MEATASFPEADTRHPTEFREVPVAVMVALEKYAAKPIHATPFDPLAVTLHLNAVSEVFVVDMVDKPAEDTAELTMPMDAITSTPTAIILDSVAAKVVLTAAMVDALLPRDAIPKHTRAVLPATTRLHSDAATNVSAAATEDNTLPYTKMPMHAIT